MRRPVALGLFALVLAASPAPAQNFGSAVAVGGREIFVGEPLNESSPGIVYVYRADGRGWREAAKLQASDGRAFDRFGRHLSVDGNRLLIGATSIDSSRGAAYVFEKDPSGQWRQAAKLVASDVRNGDAFGRQVFLQGDRAFVASWARDSSRGAVYIWRRGGDGRWTEEARLSSSDITPPDWFGSSLAAQGDLLLVGATRKDSARGQAYLFRRDPASGQWKEAAKLRPPVVQPNSRFGATVAFRGTDQLLVAAPASDGFIGAVYVFAPDPQQPGAWSARARLVPFDGAPPAQFGTSILVHQNELWIGAPVAEFQGRIYRLTRDEAGNWTGTNKLAHTTPEQGDQFGGAMAGAGDLAVVGLAGDDYGAGTAAILTRTGGAWTAVAKVLSEVKSLDPIVGGERKCGAAKKIGVFECNEVDLLAYLPVKSIGGGRGVVTSGNWGWTDPETGREYALVGLVDRTSFVDVTDPVKPVFLGSLPLHAGATASFWREIKTYRNHMLVVSDGSGPHGVQVFDLTRLRGVQNPPVTFTEDAHYGQVASVHNIVVDTTSGFAFAVGTNSGGETCGGGLHMIDIREPTSPKFAGCFADPTTGIRRTGYTHDAQCIVYDGPDRTYQGRQVCFNSSETALGIADVTDKASPKALSKVTYPSIAYAHQGWLTDDRRYFYLDDEGDEGSGLVAGTRTLIFDVSDLDDPVYAGEYVAATKSTDHNQYVVGNLLFQSNYLSGLRILDITNRTKPVEVGFFDTVPGAESNAMSGSWNNYPFFKSGTIVVNSMQEGIFLVKPARRPLVP